jgi:hypothetical protein
VDATPISPEEKVRNVIAGYAAGTASPGVPQGRYQSIGKLYYRRSRDFLQAEADGKRAYAGEPPVQKSVFSDGESDTAKYGTAEKLEITRLLEQPSLSVWCRLAQLSIQHSTWRAASGICSRTRGAD